MYLLSIAITTLILNIVYALTTPSGSLSLQLPSQNLTLSHPNTTATTLSVDTWQPTPFKVWLQEPDAYMIIQNVVTRATHDSDFDEEIQHDIADLIHLKFGKRSPQAYATKVTTIQGHVLFTMWGMIAPGVTREEVIGILAQFWHLTGEDGAATVFAEYWQKKVKVAEIGLSLN